MQSDPYTRRREGWTRLPVLGKDNLSPLLTEIKRLYLLFLFPLHPVNQTRCLLCMKPIPFQYNNKGVSFEYIPSREGPNQFVCYYKHSSVLRQDPKDAWRVLGSATYKELRLALGREWLRGPEEVY